MESREYRGSSSSSHSVGGTDPFWLILSAILILVLILVGLPAPVAGFFGQRYTYRHLSRFGWRWSAAIWLVLSLLATLSALLRHGLQQMMQRELADYVQSGKHYQFDLGRWNFGRLWSETWPVWLRTLVGVPLLGLWFEISTNATGGHTAQMLVQGKQARQPAFRLESAFFCRVDRSSCVFRVLFDCFCGRRLFLPLERSTERSSVIWPVEVGQDVQIFWMASALPPLSPTERTLQWEILTF